MAVALIVPLLAGCFGGDDSQVDDAGTIADSTESNVSRAERPDGREGGFAGFEETNATEEGVGGLDHRHDMWDGRDRITLLEADVKMAARYGMDGSAWSEARAPLAEDTLVYEGTGHVEIVLTNPQRRVCEPVVSSGGDLVCTDFGTGTRVPDPEGGPAGLHIQLKHAAAADWIDLGEAPWGAPLTFAIADATWTDMPHTGTTLWTFRAISDDPALSTLTFDLKIDIVRAEGEIPLWPGHPEFYQDTHERRVVEGSFTRSESPTAAASGADPDDDQAVPDKLVSYGTRTLHVWANITSTTSAPGTAPTAWVIQFHNASGVWRYTDETDANHTGDVTQHEWTLEVTDDGMDSPYAEVSRWGFRLRGYFEAEAGEASLSCSGGACASYEVAYDLVVVATDVPLDDYSPMSVFSP